MGDPAGPDPDGDDAVVVVDGLGLLALLLTLPLPLPLLPLLPLLLLARGHVPGGVNLLRESGRTDRQIRQMDVWAKGRPRIGKVEGPCF